LWETVTSLRARSAQSLAWWATTEWGERQVAKIKMSYSVEEAFCKHLIRQACQFSPSTIKVFGLC
jgi:hypothetical protein